jgi:hypothetical protein
MVGSACLMRPHSGRAGLGQRDPATAVGRALALPPLDFAPGLYTLALFREA